VDKPLLSVMHGQCDARPTVTFPASTGTRCAYTHRDSHWFTVFLLLSEEFRALSFSFCSCQLSSGRASFFLRVG